MPLPDARPADSASLPAILDAAWALLARGAADPDEDWHWPVIASVDARAHGDPAADARVVVLRRAHAASRELEVHSDLRAHKIAQLAAAPRVCLVFHDRRRQLQLRAWADARVHAGDAVARRAWDGLAASSKRTYLAPRRPGDEIDAPDPNLPEGFPDRSADAAALEPAFASFGAIVLRVRRLEWLHLDRAGHQRARFEWDDAGRAGPMRWIRP
jgi:pyridoxamine 5'-phosphate oxidase